MTKFLLFPWSLIPSVVWNVLALLLLGTFGLTSIRAGWRMLDLAEFRIVAGAGHVRIDGGVGELGAGVLVLLATWALYRRWFSAQPR